MGNCCWERIPNFGTLVENCKLLKIGTTTMRSITVDRSSAIVMHLTTFNKQIEKHRRQQLVMIIKHKFDYLKCVDLKNI